MQWYNLDTNLIQFSSFLLLYHLAYLFIVLYHSANLTCITFVSTASTCYKVGYADFNTKIQRYKLFVSLYHQPCFTIHSLLFHLCSFPLSPQWYSVLTFSCAKVGQEATAQGHSEFTPKISTPSGSIYSSSCLSYKSLLLLLPLTLPCCLHIKSFKKQSIHI